jgi:hypothetical protein
MALGGHRPSYYRLPRGRVRAPQSLRQKIFPFLESELKRVQEVGACLKHFIVVWHLPLRPLLLLLFRT